MQHTISVVDMDFDLCQISDGFEDLDSPPDWAKSDFDQGSPIGQPGWKTRYMRTFHEGREFVMEVTVSSPDENGQWKRGARNVIARVLGRHERSDEDHSRTINDAESLRKMKDWLRPVNFTGEAYSGSYRLNKLLDLITAIGGLNKPTK